MFTLERCNGQNLSGYPDWKNQYGEFDKRRIHFLAALLL